MKKLSVILLSSLVFSSASDAVEYVKVTSGESLTTNPNDLIELVGFTRGLDTQNFRPKIEFEGWGTYWLASISKVHDRNDGDVYVSTPVPIGDKFVGVTKVTILGASATLKITNASEINKVGPTSILVLPENARGNYDLIVESSSDSVTWTPFHSQAVQSVTAKRLFRVRIVHKGQEEAKAKAEEK